MTMRRWKNTIAGTVIGVVSLFSVGVGAQQSHTATLVWAYVQEPKRPATNFVVQRGTMAGTTCPLTDLAIGIPVTVVTYVDSAVKPGETYCYVVLAADDKGRSLPSNQVTVTVPSDLNAPGGLTVTVQ